VLISGKVKKPGMVTIGKDDDLWRAISLAGGPASGADLTRVLVATRGADGEIAEGSWNVAAYLSGNRSIALPKVKRGDTIFVPAGAGLNTGQPGSVFLSEAAVANKVFVLGAVSRPGMYDRFGNLSALAALAIAGGPTQNADMANIRVTTKAGVDRLNVAAWLTGASKVAPLIPDAGGVIVYVPSTPGKEGGGASLGQNINVIGSVGSGGRVSVGGATPLVDLVAMAGGATDKGDLGDVRVVQRGERFTIATSYDVEEYMSEGGLLAHVLVNPGDSVYVDNDIGVEVFNSAVGLISSIASVATAFILFSTAVSQ
jgi:protein involved in polysaccharide export with SLBB domain